MERLTEEQRAVIAMRNKAARSEARTNSVMEWYYHKVSCDRLLNKEQLLYLLVLGDYGRMIGGKKDLQNTWENLNL